ncbi:hypothetical protein AACH06_10975 [Ideonella sp. DXS29W]|uniref:DUF4124 domain-containing protein n=1 Tax=Ideonella lacteola TaxID=2984193 RepID=A0ABU9BRR5_9BURK
MKLAHRWVGVTLLALWPMVGHSQQLYRCGNTFSQTPCGADTATVKVPGAGVPSSGSQRPGEACAQQAIAATTAQGGSARIVGVQTAGTEVIQYAKQPVAAHLYSVQIARVDSQGRDLGQVTVQCYTSEDDQRVLKVVR